MRLILNLLLFAICVALINAESLFLGKLKNSETRIASINEFADDILLVVPATQVQVVREARPLHHHKHDTKNC